MPRFPSQSRPTSSHTNTSSEITLPEDYTSWSSLQMSPTKKQRTSGDTKPVTKQPNSSYYSRRRAQNRASQRAFRERKERHVKNLEQQLEDLHQQYEELLQAHDQQKDEISNLKAKLQDVHSGKKPSQVSHNSSHEFASTMRAQSFQSDEETLQFQQNDLLLPQSHSLTRASNFENRNTASCGSTSEEHTPFGSLLPLTPAENFEDPAMFRSLDPFFTAGEGSRCYSVNTYSESQQTGDFGSPTFSKEFAVTPTVDVFERWT